MVMSSRMRSGGAEGLPEAPIPRWGRPDLVAPLLEHAREELKVGRHVVDHKNAARGHGFLRIHAIRPPFKTGNWATRLSNSNFAASSSSLPASAGSTDLTPSTRASTRSRSSSKAACRKLHGKSLGAAGRTYPTAAQSPGASKPLPPAPASPKSPPTVAQSSSSRKGLKGIRRLRHGWPGRGSPAGRWPKATAP